MSKQSTKAHEQRVVRVFVSSTFRDMHAERDELIKRTFPQLRKLCEKRDVAFSEVDLRWGITEEQSERGEVLPICLAEIQRCRPYFIGLLGERYGWVPDDIPQALIEQEPWLQEHLHDSVTELEILHGVLNDPTMADRALFYFRDRAFIDSLPPDEQSYYLELPSKEEIEGFGQQEAERSTQERRQKLAALKGRIRISGLPVREDYPNPQALGERVLRDLTDTIERLYPINELPDPLDREALDHDAFAESRAKVYIGRQAYFDRLDQHARSDGLPLVVLGDSGSGKSALLSNWALRYRTQHPDELLLMHFIGATPYSADWAAMLRRVMGEFKRCFGIQQEIPDMPDELRAAFANWLHMAAANGKVVLILDALNQLEDRDGAPDLAWLPPEIPSNIRLIVSTLPGRALDDVSKRRWPAFRIEPLKAHERKQLIADYLAQHTKALSPARVERIADTEQTANPLYLRSLLDELRVSGDHYTLDQRIEHYLSAATIAELYEKILTRYEEDYERERAGLVRDTMSLLWAARRGLSEAELMDLLGTQHGPLPRAHWSPLYLAAEQSLVSRSGLIGFGHDYLRQAVQDKYLPGKEHQEETHLRLADYFEDQDLGARKVDELPWQLAEADSWQQLCDSLTEREFFAAAWKADQFEVKAYWTKVETRSPLRIVDAFRPVLAAPQYIAHAFRIGLLLDDRGHPEEALSLLGQLVEHFRQTGDHANLLACLGNQALILANRGELDEAMRLHKEEERICRELGDKDGLQRSLGNQALILQDGGEVDLAMRLHKEEERICRELGNKKGLGVTLGNQALILRARGELDEAMRLHKEEERICRALGDNQGLRACLGNQAVILADRGDLDEAMRLHKENERICRALGDKDSLSISLGNQAVILQDRGELDEAMRLHEEEERICRELGNKDGLSACLGNQASILRGRGELDEAMRLHKEEQRICHELGDKDGLQRSLGNQALILIARSELDEAMRLLKEKERLCRELGNKDSLSISLGNQALLLQENKGDLDEAMRLHKEKERICRELGNKDSLSNTLGNQALILQDRGDLDEAMRLHKEEERICRELGNKDALQRSLGNQALILQCRGELDEAMRLHNEEERICRELGNNDGLQGSLGNQAVMLYARGELDEAMRLLKDQERTCRKWGNKDGLQRSLGNQAVILRDRGELHEAMLLHKEEEQICREVGNKDGLQGSLGNQAVILYAQGELDEVMRLLKEQERTCRELGKQDGMQRSLGNQALILADRGEFDEAIRLHKEQERICREVENKEGLARSLINQAQLLAEQMGEPDKAGPLADEAYRIATAHALIALAQEIKPILDALHSRAR